MVQQHTDERDTLLDDQQAMLGLYADVEGFRHLLRAVLASVTMIPRSLERKYVPHHVPFESPSTQTASSERPCGRLFPEADL